MKEQNKDLEIIPVQADLAISEGVQDLIKTIQSKGLSVSSILHMPAPKSTQLRFKELSWDIFQSELHVQLRSVVEVLHAFLPGMVAQKKGSVVFILTSYTFGVPPKFLSHYISTKYALLGLMKSLAAEYSSKGITFNAVSPSITETSYISNLPLKILQINAEESPLKRNAVVDDIVPAINFLLSEKARYITGANLSVSGGTTF